MRKITRYIMNLDTMAFIPYYDEHGNHMTYVVERNRNLKVAKKQSQLVDDNLRYYGSSMRGARDGAKEILGNVNMAPVVISETLGMYWFPTQSPKLDECVWLSLQHTLDCSKNDDSGSIVTLTNDFKIDLEVELVKLHHRIQQTYTLKYELEKRLKQMQQKSNETKIVRIKHRKNRIHIEELDEE